MADSIYKKQNQFVKAFEGLFGDSPDKFIDSVKDGPLEKAILRFIDKCRKNLEKDKAIATNKLWSSIAALPYETKGNVVRVQIEMEDYASDVDQGIKPVGYSKEGVKELQPAIRKWIQQKESLQAKAKDEKAKRSLSYAIATNILKKGTMKRHGYKGNQFYSKEIEPFKIDLAQAIQESLIR